MVCVQRFLEAAHFPTTMFDPIITRDHDFCKPDPRTLDIVFKNWSLAPENIMMVGDDVKDLLTGFGAGCWTCLMMGEQNQDLAQREDCDFVITHLDSLRRFVQTQSTFEQESGYKSAAATPKTKLPMRVEDLKEEFSNVEAK
jgi:FMN phosphatase YigB (HAD superfamily)